MSIARSLRETVLFFCFLFNEQKKEPNDGAIAIRVEVLVDA
jgi:hypothetical protein